MLHAFVTLFVVLDPIGLAPVFMALVRAGNPAYQRRMADHAVLLASGVLVVFALAGNWLMDWLGVGLAAFRAAGGVLLFLLAVDMLFARSSGLRSTTEQEQAEAGSKGDISVFPLAIPLIAGPGAMTSMLLLMGEARPLPLKMLGLLGVLAAVLLLVWLSLRTAPRITGLLGITGANVVSRVLGIVLAALAAQFILDGLRVGLGGLIRPEGG
ncbi:MAG: NAAT family transporter [Candidatus Lambdaproteobacteria bacterium]|nr:NAAT family transporter [Candidatus Lambdaproteobacteria bacterium]